jgi:acyl-CoA synthetase (AMP-forming)/AMP-acid ligase II
MTHFLISHPSSETRTDIRRMGPQPIALAAAVLALLIAGVAAVALWRTYGGTPAPELERQVQARQLQARAAQASEQLVEKTKGLEVTQQESIDQLQMVQDQLQTARRLLASQQADTKRLAEQVANLTEAVDGLRQSFASVQSEPASPPVHDGAVRARAHAMNAARHRRSKARS